MKEPSLIRILLIAAAAAALASCTKSPPARFYTLTPMVAQESRQPAQGSPAPLVNIAPVEIPDYLERPQIVTRQGDNGVRLAEYERWAGSLADNVTAVLAQDLALQLGTDRVFVNPGAPFDKADYSIIARILRLDLIPGDRVDLKAQWTLFTGTDKNGAVHLSNASEKLAGGGYDTMVSAVNRAIAQLARDMAREIPPQRQGGLPK